MSKKTPAPLLSVLSSRKNGVTKKADIPRFDDFIGLLKVMLAIVVGGICGYQQLTGFQTLILGHSVIAIITFLFASQYLRVDTRSADAFTFQNATTAAFMPVLGSFVLSWTVVYNIMVDPTFISRSLLLENLKSYFSSA